MAPDRAEKTAYFRGKSLEFVADWLKKNKLSKLKSVFEGTFIIINCSTNVPALMHGWMAFITNKEILVQRIYV